jgi:hypothetical protein
MPGTTHERARKDHTMAQETRKGASGTGAPATAGRPVGAILASLPLADPGIRLDDTGDCCPTWWEGDDDWLRVEYVRARALGDTARVVELVARMTQLDDTTTTPPRDAHPAHTESRLGTVQDHTQPEPPVLIPQHGSTGGRKPYNVRLRMSLVAEAMNAPEFEGMSLAGIIEQVLEERLAQGRI